MADFEQLKRWVQQDWQAQRTFREDAEEEYNFVDGHQWTDSERQDLEANSRLPIVFNRVAPIIASVEGSEINNRTEVRFIPREVGDAKPNEVLTAGAQWFRDQAGAEDDESDAFRDLLICGMGWTETTLDFEEDEEGQPDIIRIDPLEMFYDCHARRQGLIDADRIGRVHTMPTEEAMDMFPDAEMWELDASHWMDVGKPDQVERNVAGDEYEDDVSPDYGETMKDTVNVVQIQWRERERIVEYVDPTTGQREEMAHEDFMRVQKMLGGEIPHRVFRRKVWRQAYIGNGILMENQPDPESSTFKAMTGNWDRKESRFYGLLRSMRDPQKYANKWLSTTLHIMHSNSKGGVMVEEGSVSDPREFEESWAAADSVSWIKTGRMGGIQEKTGPNISPALMGLTEFAVSSIRDVSGVNLEIMGMREAQQAGVLEYQRRQSSMTTLAKFFDSLRQYRKNQGEVILYFLKEHIAPTGRLVRILKDGQEQYVPLAMDEGTRKYDVIVDEAPSAPNEKEKAWQVVEAMMPLLQQAGLSLDDWADVLEYSPLPSSFVDMVREKAEEAKNAPPPEPSPIEQAQLTIAQSEAISAQADAASKVADAENKQRETTIKEGQAMFDAAAKHDELELKEREVAVKEVQAGIPPSMSVGNFAGMGGMMPQGMDQGAMNQAAMGELINAITGLAQQVNQGNQNVMQAVTAPKRVVYDEAGRPVGAETMQ